jgi:hypothetical protein
MITTHHPLRTGCILGAHSELTETLRYFYAQGHFGQKSSTPKKRKTLATDYKGL